MPLQLAKLSLDAIAVLVEGKPGDRCIMRSCAEALCACGAAGSLLKLVMGAPEQHTSVKVGEEYSVDEAPDGVAGN